MTTDTRLEQLRLYLLFSGSPCPAQRSIQRMVRKHPQVCLSKAARLEAYRAADISRSDLLNMTLNSAIRDHGEPDDNQPQVLGRTYHRRFLQKLERRGSSWLAEFFDFLQLPAKAIVVECNPRSAIADLARRVTNPVHAYAMIQRGNRMLAEQLGPENCLILYEEEIQEDPETAEARILDFLGLDQNLLPRRSLSLKPIDLDAAGEYPWTRKDLKKLQSVVTDYEPLQRYQGFGKELKVSRFGKPGGQPSSVPERDLNAFLMFMGYPRSGHSIVGALLDAHPQTMIANEYNAWAQFRRGMARGELLQNLAERSAKQARKGRKGGNATSTSTTAYSYQVPGMFQGEYTRLSVIGDKLGGGTSMQYRRYPETLRKFRRYIKLPLRVIHLVRNPLDNIATLARTVEDPTWNYARFLQANDDLRKELREEELYEFYREDFTADPAKFLREICDWLHLPADPDYIAACSSVVNQDTGTSRHRYDWSDEEIEKVQAMIQQYDWLACYQEEVMSFSANQAPRRQ